MLEIILILQVEKLRLLYRYRPAKHAWDTVNLADLTREAIKWLRFILKSLGCEMSELSFL
jgi:hypothetical protein